MDVRLSDATERGGEEGLTHPSVENREENLIGSESSVPSIQEFDGSEDGPGRGEEEEGRVRTENENQERRGLETRETDLMKIRVLDRVREKMKSRWEVPWREESTSEREEGLTSIQPKLQARSSHASRPSQKSRAELEPSPTSIPFLRSMKTKRAEPKDPTKLLVLEGFRSRRRATIACKVCREGSECRTRQK